MTTRPWMPFYVSDFMLDTLDLNAAEIGAYILLLMLAWRREDAALPDDMQWLKRSLKSCTKGLHGRSFNAIVPALLNRYFQRGEDGKWRNKRLLKEREKIAKSSRNAVENETKRNRNVIEKSSNSKENNGLAATHSDSDSHSHKKDKNICAVPMGTRTLESHFEEFWKIKPGRGSAANPRAPALNAYKRAVKSGADPTAINAAARVWASADTEAVGTKFTPTAAVWLNQRRFEDYQVRPEDVAKIVENEEFMKRRGYAWIENKWIKTEETNGQDQGTAGGIPARSETG